MKAAHQKGWLPALELEWERIREQRRYEIARDVLAGFASENSQEGTPSGYSAAVLAVQWADALLDALEVTE